VKFFLEFSKQKSGFWRFIAKNYLARNRDRSLMGRYGRKM